MGKECETDFDLFEWDRDKARENLAKHGVDFDEAATVFQDGLQLIVNAARNGENRDKAIGFSRRGRLLCVVHIEVEYEFIRIISAWPATATETALYHDQ
jgi:uncharacterized protein